MGKAALSCLLGDTEKSSLQLIFLSGWALIPLHLSRINAALSRFLPNPLPYPPQKGTVCFGKEQSSANPLKIRRAGLFRLTSSSISLQRQETSGNLNTILPLPLVGPSPPWLCQCWGLQGPRDVPRTATTAEQGSRVGQPGARGREQQRCSDTDRGSLGWRGAHSAGPWRTPAKSDSPETPSQVPAALTTPKGAGEGHHGHQDVHCPPQQRPAALAGTKTPH